MLKKIATALALAAAATIALADSTITWTMRDSIEGTSYMRLGPTNEAGAVAELLFDNRNVHSFDEQTFDLEYDEVAIKVTLKVFRDGNDPDYVYVEPEEGYIVVPNEKYVDEGASFVFYVYPLEGLGM